MQLDQKSEHRLAAAIVCTVIVIASILLRIWCKIKFRSGLHLEDWLMLSVMFAYMAATAVDIWGLFKGASGEELAEVVALVKNPSPENAATLDNYLKALFIATFISPIGLTFIRISVCLFYRRIFSTKAFRTRSMIMIWVCVAWLIPAFVVSLCLCFPLEKFWNSLLPGQCIDFNMYYLIIGIFETLLDFAILVLPVRAIFQVQLPLKKQLMLAGIFLLGIIAVITNALRISHIYSPHSINVSLSEATIWTHVHSVAAVVCANLPIYQPLTKKLGGLLGEVRSWLNSSFSTMRSGQRRAIGETEGSSGSPFPMSSLGPRGVTGDDDKQGEAMGFYSPIAAESNTSLRTRLNPRTCTNTAAAWRSDASIEDQAVPPQSIVHTRVYEVV
ncbi:hypothetical protein E8E14_014762 [Neopestalotiopsis sp. 37M]|nr:hypothetical protein E8E14_014762 [Neopestalotiopsis sp. 37M]